MSKSLSIKFPPIDSQDRILSQIQVRESLSPLEKLKDMAPLFAKAGLVVLKRVIDGNVELLDQIVETGVKRVYDRLYTWLLIDASTEMSNQHPLNAQAMPAPAST